MTEWDNPTEYINDVRKMLSMHTGLDEGEHSRETPERFLSMLSELTRCRPQSPEDDVVHEKHCIKWKTFPANSDEMIVVKNIPFVSLCNHHLVPFQGVAHVGYVPRSEIAGLSKFARVVKHFARQLQIQERLTAQIADYIFNGLDPRGVAVLLEAEHMCMTIRGVQAPGTLTTTSAMRGVFGQHERTAKMEFLQIIKGDIR